jgi:bifunctional non-homologous end joining protein LigD
MELIRPMLATAGELPTEPGWAYEFKWDGVRAVGYVGHGRLRLLTRNDLEVACSYPELEALTSLLGDRTAVLDGEIVALDAAGRPSFGRLQARMHVRRPDELLLRRVPVAYYVFDVLYVDGRSLVGEPFGARRESLEGLGLTGRVEVRVPPCFTEVDGPSVLEVAADYGLEGVVAKRLTSRYEPGRRSRSWVKVPLVRTQEVLIGGWQPGGGRRAGTVGSLLLGVPGDGGLRYAGKVGTGFTQAALDDLRRRLEPLEQQRPPFADAVPADQARRARWVRPELVGEVEFRDWTDDGRLRHATWRGLRPDREPGEVRKS